MNERDPQLAGLTDDELSSGLKYCMDVTMWLYGIAPGGEELPYAGLNEAMETWRQANIEVYARLEGERLLRQLLSRYNQDAGDR